MDALGSAQPSTRTSFCPRTARAGVPFSISQPGEDAVPPDTAEKRHSLPLQACPDRLTVKATQVVVNPSAYIISAPDCTTDVYESLKSEYPVPYTEINYPHPPETFMNGNHCSIRTESKKSAF